MTREERQRILGAATVAEINRLVAELPPPPPELLDELRLLFEPIVQLHGLKAKHERALKPAA